MVFTVRQAVAEDIEQVVRVQHHAFSRVARELEIDPTGLPPLTEQASDVERQLESGDRCFVATGEDGSVVGAVRAHIHGDRVEVGRLVVEDGFEGRGIASMLMGALEASFPDVEAFELFTGSNATRALQLYRRLGYVEFRRNDVGPVSLVWLEKRQSPTVCCDDD